MIAVDYTLSWRWLTIVTLIAETQTKSFTLRYSLVTKVDYCNCIQSVIVWPAIHTLVEARSPLQIIILIFNIVNIV